MKKMILLQTMLLLLVTGCRSGNKSEFVTEAFFHKYGVPVSKDDWIRNGKEGSVVELRKDGVTITRHYEKGKLDGQTSFTFPNSSTLQIIEQYDHGAMIAHRENSVSGIPMKEEIYQNGLISEARRWYEDGSPALVETYEEGYLVSGEYNTALNVVEARVINGEGTRILRDGEGELLAKESVKNKEVTERITFFPNGDPASITSFEHGLVHGKRTTFLSGGLPNTLEEWNNGNQEGITVVYLNGEKIAEVPYLKGEKHGAERRYRDGATVAEEITWRAGSQHGPRILLGEDGNPLKTEWYLEGELVSRPTFDRMNTVR